MSYIRVTTRSEEETRELGFRIGSRLGILKGSVTVCLYGDLGAGKTILVKGIASAFGIPPREVGSASFVMAAEYGTVPPFYHIDLYRVERPEDLEPLGLIEYLGAEGITVIEWAERIPEMPEGTVKIKINDFGQDSREITIEGIDNL